MPVRTRSFLPGVADLNPFERILLHQGVVILDGGLATALEGRGHVLDTALWSARLLSEEPDAIRRVHVDYLNAGADCITTASYQASFEGFAAAGMTEAEAEHLMRRSSELALEARDAFRVGTRNAADRLEPLVAASVGPYGAYLADGSEYEGRYGVDVSVLDAFHRRRFGLLAASGVDVMACETIPSLEGAEVLRGILEDHAGVWGGRSFSCEKWGQWGAVWSGLGKPPGLVVPLWGCVAPFTLIPIDAAASNPVFLMQIARGNGCRRRVSA